MAKRTRSTRERNIENWATNILLHAHAIVPCADFGFMRLKYDHRALDYAHALASHERYPELTSVKCVEAVDAVLNGIGDDCPACD